MFTKHTLYINHSYFLLPTTSYKHKHPHSNSFPMKQTEWKQEQPQTKNRKPHKNLIFKAKEKKYPKKKSRSKKKKMLTKAMPKLGEFEALTLNYVGYGCILRVIHLVFFFHFFMML
jgi:hypothetical protein